MQSSTSSATLQPTRGARRRWFTDAIIAGFVAIGTSTGALMVAYVLANGAADSQGDLLRRWLWQLTHNEVVGFSSGRPAVALALHVVLGLVWALIYARFVEGNRSLQWWIGDGPGWARGMRFGLLPWIVSLLLLLPAAMVNMLDWALSAGPLVPVGNLLLHMIYGFTLGQLYDASADEPAVVTDLAVVEPFQREAVEHSEDFGAAGILAGGAVGGIVGSFAGLPQTPPEPADLEDGPDPFEHNVLPFLIPPLLIVVVAAIITTCGTGLLQLGKSEVEIGPITIGAAVVAAIIGIFAIGVGAWFLSTRVDQSPPSSRETVSHKAEH